MNRITYSVCIPVYKRFFELKKTLESIINQSYSPLEIIIVDNNVDIKESEKLSTYIKNISHSKIPIKLIKNTINSGAVARNLGANLAKGDIVGLIDSDVLLSKNYSKNIIDIFKSDKEVVAVQGVDTNLQRGYVNTFRSLQERLIYLFEFFFQTSVIYKKGRPILLPSLVITHPDPPFDFNYESEWISTCAGFFHKKLFNKYKFCDQFITYSWNEYILFSYSIFKDKVGKMIYTSKAKYTGIITGEGRISPRALYYMAEVYDRYIFRKLFKPNLINSFIFLWSRIGRLLLFYLLNIRKKNINLHIFLIPLSALFYSIRNLGKIKKGDLSFYKKDFS